MAFLVSCCKKKDLVLAATLVMALLAAASVSGEICNRVVVCRQEICTGMCAVTGGSNLGACRYMWGFPTCCCVLESSSTSSVVAGSVHQLPVH
ncbi:hypothetical protein BDA96_05G078700 [Sorghum bicolor]|uniref:Secreted protein n=2 Tax=Sorghum bicolor TaxID=4558 RepID=A0A921UFN2_SORBI|nr:hypothetical protein BDA96_05G078700 [Sorghum bicolor]OQU83107.1 hypothetical protein SORBI_3005G077750 [Sorghum bicolor]